LPYARSAVLNSCRTLLRRRRPEVISALVPEERDLASAEAIVLGEEQRRAVMAAVRGLRIPGEDLLDGLALPPDGTELAVAASPIAVNQSSTVWAYLMRTGKVRSWHAQGRIGDGGLNSRAMSWSGNDRTLAYSLSFPPTGYAVTDLLNTTRPGRDLTANSRQLFSRRNQGISIFRDLSLTSNGKALIGSADSQSPRADHGSIQIVTTARPIAVVTIYLARTHRGQLASVLWTSPSGRVLIVEYEKLKSDPHPVFIYSKGKLTALPEAGHFIVPSYVAW
jgi:hypothetical protein